MTPIPLSLYIHIPWCVKKCPYCDFNSHQANQDIPENQYVQALLKDLESELPSIWGRPLESVFIGGGTPSLLSAAAINQLMSGLRERLPIRPNMEITMEANPGTFEQNRFKAFREAGINRLSIGIQSFNNRHLKTLGRIHDSSEAFNAASSAQAVGFDNLNIDLMFGLPSQTIEEALDDLSQAIACKPTHISWYQLTIEENTLFYHNPPAVPDDELLWKIQQQGQALLGKAGYQQYEVSAYAQTNQQCQHNLNYWQFGDYLGIGAGAHSKLSMPDGTMTRHSKYRHPKEYMEKALQANARSSEQILSQQDIKLEFMLNIMRYKEGFDQKLFEARTRQSFCEVEETIDQIIKKGLMKKDGSTYLSTEKGWVFINDIVEYFL